MDTNIKNILIIGQSAVCSALARKLKQQGFDGKIFVTTSCKSIDNSFESVDIREDDCTNLLKFALENDVSLTIPTSDNAIKSDIVSFFQTNGQNIFGPTFDAGEIATSKTFGKRFLYKIHAQTSKFGIFDKEQLALDYLASATFPQMVRCDEVSKADRLVCPTISLAREFIHTLFNKGESSILIEDFIIGHNFTVYYITDGYSAIPFSTVANYKFKEDGNGGIITNGVGAFVPDYKISEVVLSRVSTVVNNTLVSLEKKGKPYVGILGVDCTITGEDKFMVNEYKCFIDEHCASAVLKTIEDNVIKIFMDCINGLFSDDYETIKTNDLTSASCVVSAIATGNPIKGLELVEDINNIDFVNMNKGISDNYLSVEGMNFVLTRTSSTISRAIEYLYEDLSCIDFNGIKYRKDIGKGI